MVESEESFAWNLEKVVIMLFAGVGAGLGVVLGQVVGFGQEDVNTFGVMALYSALGASIAFEAASARYRDTVFDRGEFVAYTPAALLAGAGTAGLIHQFYPLF